MLRDVIVSVDASLWSSPSRAFMADSTKDGGPPYKRVGAEQDEIKGDMEGF